MFEYQNRNKSLIKTMIFMFLIMNISSLVIFSFSIKHEETENTLEKVRQSVKEIVEEKAELISVSLKDVGDKTENAGDWMEEILKPDISTEISGEYIINSQTGVLTRNIGVDQNKSAVFLPNFVPLTDNIKKEINYTEKMDPIFNKLIQQEPMLKWTYLAMNSELLRVFPSYNMDVFDVDHRQTEDIFFLMGTELNNPERKTVWTKPYVDYLQSGWMVTCTHPIYDSEDEFVGVICTDVRIDDLKEKYLLDFKLGDTGKIYLLANNGNIMYHPDYLETADKQGRIYEKNIFDDENMTNSKKESIQNVLSHKAESETFIEGGDKKIIVSEVINGQPWSLLIEFNESDFLSKNKADSIQLFQLMLIGVLLAFALAVIMYYEFSEPMNSLVDRANLLAEGKFKAVDINTGFSEINKLSIVFNHMGKKIKDYTDDLIRKNNEITSIINTIDGVLMIIDINGKIKIRNDKAENRDYFDGKNIEFCYNILKDSNCRCEDCVIPYIMENKLKAEKEFVVNGEVYKTVYYPILNKQDEILGIVVFSQCITKDIIIEKELQQMEKMAGIGQFSAAIAHEIKNPLAIIKGAIYIMKAYTEKENENFVCQEELLQIENAVCEAEKVIMTLLDFSGKETGQGNKVDLYKIVNQILMISKREIINREIITHINVDLEVINYEANVEILKIILQNLINNAVQAVGNGGYINVYARKISNEQIEIKVEDDGEGIKISPKATIFQPFYTTKKEKGGSGIGLWVTKTLIDSMGGSILVNEERIVGTEIIVTLPIKKQMQI